MRSRLVVHQAWLDTAPSTATRSRSKRAARRALQDTCNCHVACSRSLEDASLLVQQRRFDIIVQDWNLPARSPGELCRLVRERNDPCLFVIVGAPVSDILRARLLDMGADDCISSNASCEAVLARLRARIRRIPSTSSLAVRASAGLVLDDASRSAALDGSRLSLTGTEYEVLSAIAGCSGVLPRSELLLRLWGTDSSTEDPAASKKLDIHIANIRRKLGPSKHRLETVRGRRFRWSGLRHSPSHSPS